MSLLGTRLKPRPPKLRSMTAICPSPRSDSFHQRGGDTRANVQSRRTSNDNGNALRSGQRWGRSIFEDTFIRSLVLASSCRRCKEHASIRRNRFEPIALQRRRYSIHPGYQPFQQEEQETEKKDEDAQTEEIAPLGEHIPQSKYRALAETYDSPSDLWEQPVRNPSEIGLPKKLLHMPLAPRLVLTPEQENRPPYAARTILSPEDEDHDMALRRFNRLLDRPLGTSTQQIWKSYQRLPGARPRYLTDMAIQRVFRHLSWVEFKDGTSSQRYFTFLNEVVGERIPIRDGEWNTSISFAARWVKNTTSEEVKKAIETWLRMENAGVKATRVTFNILFDAAIRAGRFALADTICNEIKQRALSLDRAFRMSMIFYAGLRRDGDAVRQAFRDLVNAGEIVDTTVMNCVIVSLIRAGEGASAENAYLKMKHLHETKFGTPGPRNWRERKQRGVEMTRTARQLRKSKQQHESSFFGGSFSSDDKKEEAQRRAPIHPDAHTFRILIRHHAYTSGDMERCRELLAETKDGGWSVHGSVYLFLFRGFYLHGGHAYTAWNRRSLEEFWADFLHASSPKKLQKATLWAKAERQSEVGEDMTFFPDLSQAGDEAGEDDMLSHEDRPPFFTPNLARVVIYAFYKCAGRRRMVRVWAEIQERWTDLSLDDKLQLGWHVDKLVMDDSRYVE